MQQYNQESTELNVLEGLNKNFYDHDKSHNTQSVYLIYVCEGYKYIDVSTYHVLKYFLGDKSIETINGKGYVQITSEEIKHISKNSSNPNYIPASHLSLLSKNIKEIIKEDLKEVEYNEKKSDYIQYLEPQNDFTDLKEEVNNYKM